MTAQQLEELLGKVTQGEWRVAYERGVTNIYAGRESIMGDETYYPWVPENLNDWELIALAPSLARRVIAAERLVEALRITRERLSSLAHSEFDGVWDDDDFAGLTSDADEALTAYQEACK